MEQRISQTQLQQIVAEVQHLSQRYDAEINTEQVREILRELNLPPEFLEEAMVQLRQREALAVQQRRRRWIVASVISLSTFLVVGIALLTQTQQQMLARVHAQGDRITLAQDDGNTLSQVSRQINPQLFYRITLTEAPLGQKLSLSCNWVDPKGQVVHQNHYQTQEITKPVWNTFCRYQIGSSAPTGTWSVQAFLGDRQLSRATFEIR